MAEFGTSFFPGQDGDGNGTNGNGQGGAGASYQDPVKILSLRLPRVLGGSALAPAPLLQGQGGMGNPLMQALMVMAGLRSPTGAAAGASPMGGPSPMGMSPMGMAPMGGMAGGMGFGNMQAPSSIPKPKIIPGITGGPQQPGGWNGYPTPAQPPDPISAYNPSQIGQAASQSAGGYGGYSGGKFDKYGSLGADGWNPFGNI